jgi:hypothetical protein
MEKNSLINADGVDKDAPERAEEIENSSMTFQAFII